MKRVGRAVLLGIAGLVAGVTVVHAEAQGLRRLGVDAQGRPGSGTVVTARSRELARSTSVYADSEGRYSIPELGGGPYDLRARHFGFKDKMLMGVAVKGQPVDFKMSP